LWPFVAALIYWDQATRNYVALLHAAAARDAHN
jgi:hypothetical protein